MSDIPLTPAGSAHSGSSHGPGTEMVPLGAGQRPGRLRPTVQLNLEGAERGHPVVMPEPGSGAQGEAVTSAMKAWMKRRPPVQRAVDTGPGEALIAYRNAGSGVRSELLVTRHPGIAIAALPLHPASRAQRALDHEPQARSLHGPARPQAPLGLVSGVWTSNAGLASRLHNGRLHHWAPQAQGGGRWEAQELRTPDGRRPESLRMLGRQADGQVYLRSPTHLFRADGEVMGPLQGGPDLCVMPTADGAVHSMDAGQWRRIGTRPGEGIVVRPLRLEQPAGTPDGTFRRAQAQPQMAALMPLGPSHLAVLADDKGRLYEADPEGRGEMRARPAVLPDALGDAGQWVVRDLGLADDDQVHAVLEDRDGRSVSIVRDPIAGWQPGFVLTQPLVLQVQSGLSSPDDADFGHHIASLDGHAELGAANGTAYYRPTPESAWTALEGPDGQAMRGVRTVRTAPFGFVDRRPAYALVQPEPGGETHIARLALVGRTTQLPSAGGLPDELGGPLTVVPSQVRGSAEPPIATLPPGVEARDFAVSRDGRQAWVLTQQGQLHASQPDGTLSTRADVPEGAVAMTLGADNRLFLLAGPPASRQIHTLGTDATGAVRPLVLAEDDPQIAGRERVGLRTTRAGTVEVALRSPEDGAETTWHALLPGMKDEDGRAGPGRIDPRPVGEEPRDGLYAGSAAAVMRQQASRISAPTTDVRIQTTLAGISAADPLTSGAALRATVRGARDHTGRMVSAVATAAGFVVRAGQALAGRAGIDPVQAERLGSMYDLAAGHLDTLEVLLDPQTPLAEVSAAMSDPAARTELAPLREAQLERAVTDLQKIGIKLGAVDPTLALQERPSAGLTLSERIAAVPGQVATAARRLVQGAPDTNQGLLPALMRHVHRLSEDRAQLHRSPREQALMQQLAEWCNLLMGAGVHLPEGRPSTRRDAGDPIALRRTSLAQSLDQFERIETAPTPDAARRVAALAEADPLRRLTDAGFLNWSTAEAFDDVVTTFRASMDDTQSVRRQQMMRSLNLPLDSAPDQIAVKLAEMALDLANRSTFFSIASDSLSATLNIAQPLRMDPWSGVGMTVGGESIHALGFERIGDSLEGDAGLVVFFVRHHKGQGAYGQALNFDLRAGPGQARLPFTGSDRDITADLSGGMSIGFRAAMSGQLGKGAAIIVPPDRVIDFMARLVDPQATESWDLFEDGVGRKGIELDLVETGIGGEAGLNGTFAPTTVGGTVAEISGPARRSLTETVSPGPSQPAAAPDGRYGGDTPDTVVAGGRRFGPGGYGATATPGSYGAATRPPEASAPDTGTAPAGGPAADLARMNAQALGALRLGAAVSANEMALVLNHLWNNSLGIERQGGVSFSSNLSAVSRIGGGGSVTETTGRQPSDPIVVSGGMGGLQLAGLQLRNGDLFGLPQVVNGTYKRTLDAAVAQPLSSDDWSRTLTSLAKMLPTRPELATMAYPDDPAERIEVLQGLRDELAAGSATLRARDGVVLGQAAGVLTNALQREQAAHAERALVPGAKIELNLLGRQALFQVPDRVLGHLRLSGLAGSLAEVQDRIPGLADAMARLSQLREGNQVRLVFEMTPAHLERINESMVRMRSDGQWPDVMEKTMRDPGLYRLTTVALHNTDDNMSTAAVNTLALAHGRGAGTAKQQFLAEIQFNYDDAGELQRAQILEGSARAMARSYGSLEQLGLQPRPPRPATTDPRHFGPPSPR